MAGSDGLVLDWGDGSGTDEVEKTAFVTPMSLVMAVDASKSIDDNEYTVQREGTALALRNVSDDVVAMAQSGTPVVLSYIEFSDQAHVRVEPRILRDAEDVESLAREIEAMERVDLGSRTYTSNALALGTDIHEQVNEQYGPLSRKVTDVSADGFGTQRSRRDLDPTNSDDAQEFENVRFQRDRALSEGVEVNAILMPEYGSDLDRALRNDDPMVLEMLRSDDGLSDEEINTLLRERPELFSGPGSSEDLLRRYHEENVITGFTVNAKNAEEYGETLEMKLRRELLIGQNDAITNTPVAPSQSNDADLTARPI